VSAAVAYSTVPARQCSVVDAVVGLAASAVAVLLVASGPPAGAVTLLAWTPFVAAAAVVDARTARLPDQVVLPGLLVTLAGAAVSGRIAPALLGCVMLGAPLLLGHLLRPEGVGFGDVKFGCLIGAGLGTLALSSVALGYLLSVLLHLALCAAIRAGRRPVPFGPALSVAAFLTMSVEIVGRFL
jgi:leader peptidase (prepilin peptidase)/N-methyltransferase